MKMVGWVLGFFEKNDTHFVGDRFKYGVNIFEERLNNDPTLYGHYHEDFRLCNAKLNEKYASDGLYEALNSAVYIPRMDELDEKNLLEIKKYALDDFNYPSDHVEQELCIFSLEEILAYLERSAYRALDVYRPLLATGNIKIHPYALFD